MTTTTINNDIDINDVFDNIVFCEKNILEESFQEGVKKGKLEGDVEGFHLGYHRGCELGYEIGYYKGFVEVLLNLPKEKRNFTEKSVAVLSKLKKLVDDFPRNNQEDCDMISLRDQIRVIFKRLCSLLKIDSSLPVEDRLSY